MPASPIHPSYPHSSTPCHNAPTSPPGCGFATNGRGEQMGGEVVARSPGPSDVPIPPDGKASLRSPESPSRAAGYVSLTKITMRHISPHAAAMFYPFGPARTARWLALSGMDVILP